MKPILSLKLTNWKINQPQLAKLLDQILNFLIKCSLSFIPKFHYNTFPHIFSIPQRISIQHHFSITLFSFESFLVLKIINILFMRPFFVSLSISTHFRYAYCSCHTVKFLLATFFHIRSLWIHKMLLFNS